MKKYKLKKWVKVVLGLMVIGIVVPLYVTSKNQFEVKATECDNLKGYTCSYHEVEQFMKNN